MGFLKSGRITLLSMLGVILSILFYQAACHKRKWKRYTAENELCFPVIGDMGGLPRPPYQTKVQKKVAQLLGKVSSAFNCSFIVGVGDNFYFRGVSNVDDPRFHTTFENTYTAPSLQVPWYMIAGNHDHVGNVSAQIAYTKKSRRWHFPNYFYSETHTIPGTNKTLQVVMIDTMILCYYNNLPGAPSATEQYRWIEDQLKSSTADFLIVAGHHPVLSAGVHGNTYCLQKRLKPMLEKYGVTAYLSGHDHNLQHLVNPGSKVHYLVSGSGNFIDPNPRSKGALKKGELKFFHGLFGGFILMRATDQDLVASYMTVQPKKVHQVTLKPRNRKLFNLINVTTKSKSSVRNISSKSFIDRRSSVSYPMFPEPVFLSQYKQFAPRTGQFYLQQLPILGRDYSRTSLYPSTKGQQGKIITLNSKYDIPTGRNLFMRQTIPEPSNGGSQGYYLRLSPTERLKAFFKKQSPRMAWR